MQVHIHIHINTLHLSPLCITLINLLHVLYGNRNMNGHERPCSPHWELEHEWEWATMLSSPRTGTRTGVSDHAALTGNGNGKWSVRLGFFYYERVNSLGWTKTPQNNSASEKLMRSPLEKWAAVTTETRRWVIKIGCRQRNVAQDLNYLMKMKCKRAMIRSPPGKWAVLTPTGTGNVSDQKQSSPKLWCKMIPINDNK